MAALPLIIEKEDRIITNPAKKRHILKVKMIKYLHQTGYQSIPDLCSVIRVSAPTLKRLLDELLEEGLVNEKGLGKSIGGRRPYVYGINPNSRFVLGIDMGRFETRIGLFNLASEPVEPIVIHPEGLESTTDILKTLVKQISKLLTRAKVNKELILGAGVAIPGLIDLKTGISHTYLNFDEQPLEAVLTEKLGLTVYLEHDTRSMALGELAFGHAKGKKNVLCLNLGSGIGLSILINGRMYHGVSGYAGEFGHVNVEPDGDLCYCGKKGCLETVASGRTLREKVKKDLKADTPTLIKELVNGDPEQVNLPVILEAAIAGDQYAIELITTTGLHLGKSIACLIHIFNPELIILGGGMSAAGNLLLDPVQQNLNTHCIPRIRQDTDILVSDLGYNACLMGTVALVMDKVFERKA